LTLIDWGKNSSTPHSKFSTFEFNCLPILTVPLIEKVREVERVFRGLDEAIGLFQNWSTLHCKFGCGKCCSKADIEATPLEFLPFAHYLYQQELAFEWLEKIKATDQDICLILNPTQAGAGQCSEYIYRGLICRLFGYSARTNKYGDKELVTCQIIKTEQAPAYELAQKKVIKDNVVPIMNQYYMQLHAIDAELARDFYPINQAIKKAIETVLHYYAYRN
jgi:Fe-S-cluster containining protein